MAPGSRSHHDRLRPLLSNHAALPLSNPAHYQIRAAVRMHGQLAFALLQPPQRLLNGRSQGQRIHVAVDDEPLQIAARQR